MPRTVEISKTTISGYLSLGITICVYLTVSPPAGMSPKIAAALTVALGVMKAVNGSLMKDAGEQKAALPDGTVAKVPSHENPDDPANKPI